MNQSRILKPVIPVALLVGAGLLAWGTWHLLGESTDQYTNDAFVHADFTLAAPKVPGFIREVLVEDNQMVKAGQLLARIDDRDYRAALEGARAKVASAQAQLENAGATLERQDSLIEQAQATLEADRAERVFAQHELERYQKLVGRGAGTLQAAQLARSRFDSVLARQAEHSAALLATRKQTDILTAERDAAQAALSSAQAALRQAELDLSHTELRAPIDGMVGRRAVRVGAFVKPGDALLAVVPLERAYVVANFQETQLTHVRPGQEVEIAVDTFPGESLRGRVESIAPATGVTFAAIAPDNATGNFTKVVQRIPVKVVLDAGQPLLGQLRVGMSVEASIDTRSEPEAVAEVPL
ncbi:HlyD family secretion protein [Pseudomonas sp. JS3066]|jgi:membrane fusion protein (multidrug efflux system)|uniref:HlyD family secretion protein n=1 Tax=unclassified Pseudomonas TaxID=196821 RepID=UPI000EA9EEF1|nr:MULTISPECIES: HlyD family secretion protein [unclassified Pseudomonas]AYF87855.1 HlyD family secretion protein [Pseudomonas sp. DY-1]MDH4655640.1 HlyD family secretion protein [Pseudomonas sp. BN606]MRK19776.1 HlyD family secretion protein [Pseudomonas sp. JG-B]WVK94578.1 HlyD family secretion protein [Pseudomonas sp. JS3066]